MLTLDITVGIIAVLGLAPDTKALSARHSSNEAGESELVTQVRSGGQRPIKAVTGRGQLLRVGRERVFWVAFELESCRANPPTANKTLQDTIVQFIIIFDLDDDGNYRLIGHAGLTPKNSVTR
jgi:hypothetical protein